MRSVVSAARPRRAVLLGSHASHQGASGAPNCCVPFGAAVANTLTPLSGPVRRGGAAEPNLSLLAAFSSIAGSLLFSGFMEEGIEQIN